MAKLEQKLQNPKYYKDLFESWVATELIIDDKRAMWELKEPDSTYNKVCLYRDDKAMFVYGCYGQFSFDSMTWLGSVYNLKYENEVYQTEKLASTSKTALTVFDEDYCVKDVIDWTVNKLSELFDMDGDVSDAEYDQFIEDVCFALTNPKSTLDRDLDELMDDFPYQTDIAYELLSLAFDMRDNCDEHKWINYLNEHHDAISEFTEINESGLYDAGKRLSQSYYISMYALKICGEKLKRGE